jgi:glycerol-3-phosphate acyltransferase PlsY
MTDWILPIACIASGYLLGSIPNAVIVSRAHGVDILKAGSGNPGATNVKRVVGKGPGNLVFFLDLLKGLVVAAWPLIPHLAKQSGWESSPVWLSLAGMTGALLGHSYSIFIRFKGGKGVATAMGALLAVMPAVVLSGILIWVAFFYRFRYVSLASIAFAVSLPIFTFSHVLMDWALPRTLGNIELGIAIGVALLIVLRHIPNIRRLIDGTEHRFSKQKQPEQTPSN